MDEEKKVFPCERCGFQAKSELGLKTHLKKHEREDRKAKDDPHAFEFPDGAQINVIGRVKEPSLGDANFDPFAKFKVDEHKYYYRALNVRPQNLRVREAQGFKTIPESEYGDLVLGRLPKEQWEALEAKNIKKIKSMEQAPKAQFAEAVEEENRKVPKGQRVTVFEEG
jgi:hypothetical protein